MSAAFDITADLTDAEKRILVVVSNRNKETITQSLRRSSLRDIVRNEAYSAMNTMISDGTIPEAVVSKIEAVAASVAAAA